MVYTLATLVYCIRNGKVLLMQRRKAPYAGSWVAPGGKLETGESPHACALREFHEETGLVGHNARLRALVSETSTRSDWQWLIFVYRVDAESEQFVSDEREGKLAWWDPAELETAADIPPADRHFMQDAMRAEDGLAEYHCEYDQALELIQISRVSD